MDQEEIITLKETIVEEAKDKTDQVLEEDAIYAMSEGAGWKIMVKKANKKIAALLEPISREEAAKVGNLELVGAMAIGRGEAISALREFVNEAEAVKNAKRAMQKPAEESKPEA